MRLLRKLLVACLLPAATACTPAGGLSGDGPPAPTYSRDTIREIALYGLQIGMDAEQACLGLTRVGLLRGSWNGSDPDCSAFPDSDDDDGKEFVTVGDNIPTPFGKIRFIVLEFRRDGDRRRLRAITMSTDEKEQQEALEGATREQFGTPTFYAKWNYRVMYYGPTEEQADYENVSDYESCVINLCPNPEEAGRCIAVVERFATAMIKVVVFEWGREIKIRDHTETDHNALLDELARVRDGTLVQPCPVHKIH